MNFLNEEYGKTIITAICVSISIMIILTLIPLIGEIETNALVGAVGLTQ